MENRIVVRNAEKEDVRQIAEILVEDWQKAYRGIVDDAFLDAMNADRRYEIEVKRYERYTVATDGHEILGYAWLETTEGGEADCEVIALYVRYSKRNNGIGRLLIRHAIRHFREIGKKRMIIWCLRENYESRKFYEKTGGKEYKTGFHNWGGKEYEMISYLYDLESCAPEQDARGKKGTRINIETERLFITEFTPDMAQDVCDNSHDDDTRRFVPDEVFETTEEAGETVAFLMSQYGSTQGPLACPVLLKRDGANIGYVQIVPIGGGKWEIGYHIAKKHTGNGYATEAVKAFLPVMAKEIGIDEIHGICLSENAASKHVLCKCGFIPVFEGAGEYQGEERMIFRSVWRAQLPVPQR